MAWLSLAALAIALAMDATAVAAARGLVARKVHARDVIVIAALFGGAQAIMPLAGWLLGAFLGPFVAAFDHWIAFALLTLVGGKMVVEAWRGGAAGDDGDDGNAAGARGDGGVQADVRARQAFALRPLLVLSVATSIDAFAAGITLPLLAISPWIAVTVIGGVTAALTAAGALAGVHVGRHFGQKLEIAGGLILIALGAKILIEHLS